jgi:hypothetical protein
MFLALLLGSFSVGLLLGVLTRLPFKLLLVPSLAIALVYWVGFGWLGDDYDIGREGLLLITAWIGALFVALWAAGIGIARADRARLSREAL